MKKLLYSSLLCALLGQTYMFTADIGAESQLFEDDLKLGDFDTTIKNPMDDSDEVQDLGMPEAPATSTNLQDNVSGLDSLLTHLKNHPEEALADKAKLQEEFGKNKTSEPMPELTAQDLQGAIQMHRNIAKKQINVAHTLDDLLRKLGGRMPGMAYGQQQMQSSDDNLSESERALIKDIKKVSALSHQAGNAHSKIADVYESFQALDKDGFEPGEKLESMAAELSKKATEASEEADKAMESLLGLKPIIKF